MHRPWLWMGSLVVEDALTLLYALVLPSVVSLLAACPVVRRTHSFYDRLVIRNQWLSEARSQAGSPGRHDPLPDFTLTASSRLESRLRVVAVVVCVS